MRCSLRTWKLLVAALGVGSMLGACASEAPSGASSGSGKTAQSPSGAAGSGLQPSAAGREGSDGSASSVNPVITPVTTKPVAPTSDTCASIELEPTRVTPRVWLMIDGSGSMGAPLDLDLTGPPRWQLLRDALVAADSGLVPRLQGAVKFGLYVYDGGLSLPGMSGPQCPRTVISEPALNNAAALSDSYPQQETGASTPTHSHRSSARPPAATCTSKAASNPAAIAQAA